MSEFMQWLKENKISASGKYRDRRWGGVSESPSGDLQIRVCVQYDEYLEPFLANESPEMQTLITTRTGHRGCGRCIDGKCAYTGFDLVNPTEEQLDVAKRLIKFRINAIKEGRVPRCSYVKISRQGQQIEPCAIHKVCDPKCKAMKKY